MKKAVMDTGPAGHQDVMDLGDISTARGPEMIMALRVRLWDTLGTADFHFKIAR